MRVGRVWNSAMVGLAGLVFTVGLLGWAQYSPSGGGAPVQNLPNTRSQGSFGGMMDSPDSRFADKRLRALNAERQKSMVSDADKLVKLARQLDAEIASNETDEMTPEELRKLAEIEKLAHNVKAKMAQSFGTGPEFRQPLIPMGGGPGQQ